MSTISARASIAASRSTRRPAPGTAGARAAANAASQKARDIRLRAAAANARAASTIIKTVDDPYDGKGLPVAVNRRTDILETEFAHGRLSEAAYRTGQIVQAVFQRLGYAGVGAASLDGAGSSDPVEMVSRRETRLLEATKDVRNLMDGVVRQLGMIDTRLLRRLLGDRMTYAECAAAVGKSGERGTTYIAQRFRDALEALAEAWASKGTSTGRIVSISTDAPDTVTIAPTGRRPVKSPISAGKSELTRKIGYANLQVQAGLTSPEEHLRSLLGRKTVDPTGKT